MTDRDELIKSCQTCLHNNVCKFTDEELCKGTKVKDLITECKDYFANGVTVTDNNVGCKWRPESEPPKENGAYLVSLTSFSGKHTWQDVCKFANNLEKVDAFDFKGIKRAGWYSYKDGDYYEVDDITHWMPLPKPPKEVE